MQNDAIYIKIINAIKIAMREHVYPCIDNFIKKISVHLFFYMIIKIPCKLGTCKRGTLLSENYIFEIIHIWMEGNA